MTKTITVEEVNRFLEEYNIEVNDAALESLISGEIKISHVKAPIKKKRLTTTQYASVRLNNNLIAKFKYNNTEKVKKCYDTSII